MAETNPFSDFRDHLSTIDEKGKRIWIFPKKPKGPLYQARTLVANFLLAIFFILPFIKVNGNPLLLLNFFERRFIIFGIYFWPQDFYILFILMISLVVFVILFTITFGRLWCGWTCPQTIWMEMLFRKIEYLIDGDGMQQKMLINAPWTARKIFKRILKHGIFVIISILIINTFIAYIIGIDQLLEIIKSGPANNRIGFFVMLFFSALFYMVFSYFREQICTIVCPYGRLQSVLLDSNSIVVAYDYKRGEPRGARNTREIENNVATGHCVDCSNCIIVCPTGIDIRNGTQLECINCTACIDACNAVMTRFKMPKGLIRYTSENGIVSGEKIKPGWRMISYSVVLAALLSFGLFMLFSRTDIETTILRTPGLLFQQQEDGKISNLYNVKMINKRGIDLPVQIRLISHKGDIKLLGGEIKVKGHSSAESLFFVIIDKHLLKSRNNQIELAIFSSDKLIEQQKVNFFGPGK